jgi:hypothetical protein
VIWGVFLILFYVFSRFYNERYSHIGKIRPPGVFLSITQPVLMVINGKEKS